MENSISFQNPELKTKELTTLYDRMELNSSCLLSSLLNLFPTQQDLLLCRFQILTLKLDEDKK